MKNKYYFFNNIFKWLLYKRLKMEMNSISNVLESVKKIILKKVDKMLQTFDKVPKDLPTI